MSGGELQKKYRVAQTLRPIVSARFWPNPDCGGRPPHRDIEYSRDRDFLDVPSEVASIPPPKGGIRARRISRFKH